MKQTRNLYLVLLLITMIALWAVGCGSGSDGPIPDPQLQVTPPDHHSRRVPPPYDWEDPDLPARLDEALVNWAEDSQLYGAAAAVFTPDGYLDWSGSYGVENIETKEVFKTTSPARAGSATKPFTSSVVMQLIDDRLLTLDTTLAEFVPEYPNGEKITVDLLLRHRSGILEVQLVDLFFILHVLSHSEEWMEPERILEWTYLPFPFLPPIFNIHTQKIEARKPVGEPSERYYYSQPGYIALGLMVEKRTDMALADVYRQRICERLGLSGTHLPRKDDPLEPAGYTNVFGLLDKRVPGDMIASSANAFTSSSWSSGAMISTAPDLVVFLSSMMEGGLFSEERLADVTDWMVMDPNEPEPRGTYGMGLVRKERDGGYTTVGHNGLLPGGGSVMQYIEELDVYVGAVFNTDPEPVGEDLPTLEDRVVRALLNE